MTGQPKKFQRLVEDFTCEHCGADVQGNGYTNHCPFCLWSKHVDIHPGDRSEPCNGMMEPVRVEHEQRREVLVHRCQRCGNERRNTVAVNDDRDELVALAAKWSAQMTRGMSSRRVNRG